MLELLTFLSYVTKPCKSSKKENQSTKYAPAGFS